MSPDDSPARALHRDFGRLEGKVDAIHTTAQRIETSLNAQDDRISALERKQWHVTGAAAVLAWMASSVLDFRALLGRFL